MKRALHAAAAVFSVGLPAALLANVTGTPTINANQAINFDTGTVSSSGGDILFTGAGVTFQASATGRDLGALGASGFSALTSSQAALQASATGLSNTPILGPGVNHVIAYKTNGGNLGAFLVNSLGPASITIQFLTFSSGTGAGGGPTISAVLNNYGLIPAGFSNSGIAPSTLFIIKGSGLADPNAQALPLQDSTAAGGLPKTLNGASVSVTVGSTTVQPVFYYAIAAQLALVLPAGTPTGAATVTVTFNGQTSAPFSFQVVKSAPGIAAAGGTGSGTAHAQAIDYSYYGYNTSIPPGATIRLIGSGFGADDNSARDTMYVQPTASESVNALAHVYIGGVDSTIFHQGPEGFPGLDELDVTVPMNAPTGCFVSVVGVTAAGVPTNFLTLPIGTGVCSDPALGTSGSTYTTLSGQTNVRTGFVGLAYLSSPGSSGSGTQLTQSAFASFQQFTGSAFGSAASSVSLGGCIVVESAGSGEPAGTSTPLNAGTITVSSPNAGISPVQLMGNSFVAGFYTAQLPSGFLTMAGGNFTVAATAGTPSATVGAVGAFNTQITFPTPLLQWTNQAADGTVVRASGVTVTWTGGSPGTYVTINGSSSGASSFGSFTCLAPVAAGTFTVPPYVLATLPTTTAGGSLSLANYTVPQQFTATGLDYGQAEGYTSYDISATYQ